MQTCKATLALLAWLGGSSRLAAGRCTARVARPPAIKLCTPRPASFVLLHSIDRKGMMMIYTHCYDQPWFLHDPFRHAWACMAPNMVYHQVLDLDGVGARSILATTATHELNDWSWIYHRMCDVLVGEKSRKSENDERFPPKAGAPSFKDEGCWIALVLLHG